MLSIAASRVQREFLEVVSSEEAAQCGIRLELVDDNNFCELKGEIMGPPNTPYEGGKFELRIEIPAAYPFQPPRLSFVTKVWHANISSATGSICLNILGNEWSPSLSLRSVLLSLQILLATPVPDDPQDAVVGHQFIANHEMFELTARHWTYAYAGGPSRNQDFENKIRRLMDLGCTEIDSRSTLSFCDWDLEFAISELGLDDLINNNDDEYDANN